MSEKNNKLSQREMLGDHETRLQRLENDMETTSSNVLRMLEMLGCMIDFVGAEKFHEFRRDWVAKKKGEESLAEETGALKAGTIVEVETFEVDGIAAIKEIGADEKVRSYRGMVAGVVDNAKPLLGLRVGEKVEVDGPEGKHVIEILATYKPVRGGSAQA